MEAIVTVKCVECGMKRKIDAGEVPEGEQPMCEKCFMPMLAYSATAK